MGDWYVVIKTIKGRQYRYRQRTWREGSRVRTESYSLGPVVPVTLRDKGKRKPSETPEKAPAIPGLTWLTTSTVGHLRDPAKAAAEWVTPHSRFRKAGPIKRIPALDAVVKACGVKIVHGNVSSAKYVFGPGQDFINMPPMRCWGDVDGIDRQYAYYSTLFHEIAHWTGHSDRLGRFDRMRLSRYYSQSYAREEMVAEATTVIVLTKLGYPPPKWGQHTHYFRFWANTAGNSEETYGLAMDEAERAAEFILTRVNTTKSPA